MKIGIDATNIRSGGGLSHLKGILSDAEPEKEGINQVTVWSSTQTLTQLPDKSWLEKKSHPWLNRNFVWSFLFQIFLMGRTAKKEGYSILFVPGGTFLGRFEPVVSMSRNMLPFQKSESQRYKKKLDRLRFALLKITQSWTLKRSTGIIFLTNFAKDTLLNQIRLKNSTIIPHGIDPAFIQAPKEQKEINLYNYNKPFKLLYVSVIAPYKHQWNVAQAIMRLRKDGYPIELDLVGNSVSESLVKLKETLVDSADNTVNYLGSKSHKQVAELYKRADAAIFASSCENMPNILIESMAAGLPIASSNMGPMPEVLGSAGFYFNPLNCDEIYLAVKEMLESPSLRLEKAEASFAKSSSYTWKDCAAKTFAYLAHISKKI